VNDLHYLDDDCGKWLEGVVHQMKTTAAEFCLIVGDLADDGKHEHFAAVRDIFGGLGIPFYTVIGNHDYLTQTDCSAYTDIFPKRINFHFEHRGWQFVGLDSSEGQHAQNTSVSSVTLKWLDNNLWRLSKKKPTVMFTHFPMGPEVRYRPINADAALERFRDYNLQAVYNGHFHGFTEHKLGNTVLTTDKCCALKRNNHDGTPEKGYFICLVKDGAIHREFVEYKMPEMPKST
ncbi:MAG TPA: metallophosphoesterase, partial [Candidatus Baltobacteraceae bacterium]|nr:metallophosphoesterase [Candidatus Baltobacteraceae bacterium]